MGFGIFSYFSDLKHYPLLNMKNELNLETEEPSL